MPHGPYTVNMVNISVSAAITLVQIKAGATNPLQLIEARCSQSGSTTSAMQRIQIAKLTAASTVTSTTPLLENPSDAAANAVGGVSATGVNASAEGTYTDIYVDWDFNVLQGFLWQPVLEDRIWVAAAGIIGMRFPGAPGSALTIDAQLKFLEYP
jgi:hypothetical protein